MLHTVHINYYSFDIHHIISLYHSTDGFSCLDSTAFTYFYTVVEQSRLISSLVQALA